MIDINNVGGPGTPAMTQVVEIAVIILGIMFLLNGIFDFIIHKTWKKWIHGHNDELPTDPPKDIHQTV